MKELHSLDTSRSTLSMYSLSATAISLMRRSGLESEAESSEKSLKNIRREDNGNYLSRQ